MATIAVLIADMFEDSEYLQPATALKKQGHVLVHLGLQPEAVVSGKKEGTRVKIDLPVRSVSVADYDALLIPGGYSPDKLRADDAAVRFVRHFMESNKPVFAICHGPQLLITAQSLGGRRLTGWKSIRQDIINAGAEFVDEKVVVDGNLVTSRGPADLPAFIDASLRKLV